MNFRDRPPAVWALPLVVLLIALAMFGSDFGGAAARMRGILFDAYQHSAPRPYAETEPRSAFKVRVLTADQPSLERFGPWPWPRALLAKLVGELKGEGAALVVFTLPLDVPDPVSPRSFLAEIPPGPDYDQARTTLASLPSPDSALAQSFSGLPSVSGFVLGAPSARRPQLRAPVVYQGAKEPFSQVPDFSSASGAVAAIENASAGVGALNLSYDSDGKLRRMGMIFRSGAVLGPSIDAEAMRLAGRRTRITVKSDEGESSLTGRNAGIASIWSPAGELPTAPDGSLWVAYSGPHAARDISAADLDAGHLAKDSLRNAIVYVGAPTDLVTTPDGVRSAAEVHAEALENILLGVPLRRPASAALAEFIFLAIAGAAVVVLLARFGLMWSAWFAVGAIAVAGAVSWRLYSVDRVLFDAFGPGFAIACVIGAGATARLYELGMTRLRLRSAFADALPAATVEKLARAPQLLKLEGESRTVTYVSCGIRSFAALAASFKDDPTGFTRLIGRALTPLMDEALAHGGAIDRLTSDGFTAFWNAPLDDPEHAIHACEAATRMTQRIAEVNETLTRERRIDGSAISPVEIGIGISTGPAIAGGFLAHGRTAYSVNGDCTIVANRIQALSAQYGPAVIVGEPTRKSSERGFAFLEVDYIAAGAHEEPVKLYAMLGNPVMRASPKFRALMTFHEHIFQSLRTQQWEKSRGLIEQCRKLSGASQKLYDLHLARIAYFEANPPGADWDGAFRPILK